eukprot:TRINITY_DN89794_c0_g1_i1.p1 TRINITY_DN89794_c0_g1~~TRINITY_DN89794_c0_g1_i1.p1  ORF type:complete len:383 (-),score=64.08 TRINITY_DN89794_c0_g1_i1:72-1220(-)
MSSLAVELQMLSTDEFTDEQHVPQPRRSRVFSGALSFAVVVILGLMVLVGVDHHFGGGAAWSKATELDDVDCMQTCGGVTGKLSQCMSTCSPDCSKCKPFQDEAMECASRCDPRQKCTNDCHENSDPSCMQTCAPKMAKCMQTECLQTKDYYSCELKCKTTACGEKCLATNQLFQGCINKCYNASDTPTQQVAGGLTEPSSTQSAYMMSAEGKCHLKCGQDDAAQMKCMNGCMPKVQACTSKMCAKYTMESSERMSCSQTCQKECGQSCSKLLRKAQDCHQSCMPAGRNKCLNDCQQSYDDSCMHNCGPKAGTCFMKCPSNDPTAFSECQKTCYEDACGKDCMDNSTKKQTCTSACYSRGTPGVGSSVPQVSAPAAEQVAEQ